MTTESDSLRDAIFATLETIDELAKQRRDLQTQLEHTCYRLVEARAELDNAPAKPIALKMGSLVKFDDGTEYKIPFDLYYGPQRDPFKKWKLITGTNATLFIKELTTLGGIHPLPPSQRKRQAKPAISNPYHI